MFLQIACGVLFLLFLVLLVISFLLWTALQCRDNIIDAYKNDYMNLTEKHEHILTQVGKHGFKIRTNYRSACFIELEKEE